MNAASSKDSFQVVFSHRNDGGSEKIGGIGMMGDHHDTFRSFRYIPIPNDIAVLG